MKYQITNLQSGIVLGIYRANSPQQALEAMAQDAGYTSYQEACRAAPVSQNELEVLELPEENGPPLA